MRTILTTGLAALALAGTAVTGATPVAAQSWHHGSHGDFRGFRGRGFDRDDGGIALAAGVIGLGLGAAIASDHNYYYGPGYGAGPYYGDDYGYRGYPGYATCYGRQRVWDPYVGAYVVERVRYAC